MHNDAANGQSPDDWKKPQKKNRGQNTGRKFGSSRDEKGLCQTRATYSEFSPAECRFGTSCKYEHDLRKYLQDWKREDLTTFDGICPIWSLRGRCNAGWKCRFAGSHMQERDVQGGRKELILVVQEADNPDKSIRKTLIGKEMSNTEAIRAASSPAAQETTRLANLSRDVQMNDELDGTGIVNMVSTQDKQDLMKKRVETLKADCYSKWLDKNSKESETYHNRNRLNGSIEAELPEDEVDAEKVQLEDLRAQFTEPPFLPSEKRRIYFGPETPVLAPLTTQGNLPFRRLCVQMGAQLTYSEMAMSFPLLQGQRSEWALMRAHESETTPPKHLPRASVVVDYDNSRDLKFGAQIAANKPWQALRATEILSRLCPHLRVIDVNCGCPIDLVYRQGAGSALLDNPSKLEKMVLGMNAVSGEIPITVKIRMGTKDNKPTAQKLVERLVIGRHERYENMETSTGSCGVAAITLHGRSRQQRYTKNADWDYISDCAALMDRISRRGDDIIDTIREVDARNQPASGKIYFIGNGDCYSHVDYNTHLQDAKVDSVMVARGALIKPWIFEEIEQGQYLDKTATERLSIIEQYVRYGLETWGSDEVGVGTTRRFLLEWLSFAHRYVPVGIMEHLPPSLQDRPPAWKGRNELETLLGSNNYKDWIKIR